MAIKKQSQQEFARWLASSLLLPALTTVVVWQILEIGSVKNAFGQNYGSGDLFAIAAMLFVILGQEIEKVPLNLRGLFLILFQEHALAFSGLLWLAFGAAKVLAAKTFLDFADGGVIAMEKVSWISIVSLLIVGCSCLVARIEVMRKQ